MSQIKEVDALADFNLTLDHFYDIVKAQVSNLQVNQYIQLQATAIPLDVSINYPWFSFGNLNSFFNVRLDPTPVADNITMLAGATLSNEYINMLSNLLSLVEYKELSVEVLDRIDSIQTRILNNGSRINALLQRRLDDWILYAKSSMLEMGNLAIFTHWSQGHHATTEINYLQREQATDQALISALRLRQYANPDHRAAVDAFAAATGPASRMRYPRFEDKEYGDETKKFNAVYFASLPDNDSTLFANRQLMTAKETLTTITTGGLGSFSNSITKGSVANSTITTDWSASASGGWGPFKFNANINSHQRIKDDFASAQSITVGAKSLQAIPIDATSWLRPEVFSNEIVFDNRRIFEQYLGPKGSLLYYPTHLIVARGLNLKFSSSQLWQYDYESDFSSSGNASAKIFGVGWGGGGGYSQSKKEQKVERRGNDLVLDDGDNIRILGYVATKNVGFETDIYGRSQLLSPRFLI